MASTGTAIFTITRDQLISASLRLIRVLQDGATPGANDLTDCAQALNILIKKTQSNGLQLWAYQSLAIPMVASKTTYTIGPSGADVTSVRPLRLFDGAFLRQTTNGQSMDTPLRVISRLEYLQFGSKGSTSTPNSIYYHPGIDIASGATSPSLGYGTLYVYTTPLNAAVGTIYGNFQRPLYDMTSGTDEFDLPSEWFMYLKWALAAEIADEYEVPEDRIVRIMKRAEGYRQDLDDWSVEWAPLQMTPDWSMGNFRSM